MVEIKNIKSKGKTMTKQEIFDKVVLHARTQKQQAIEKDCCRYRTKDGLKCFIGALIPDDKYKAVMEGPISAMIVNAIGVSQDKYDLYGFLIDLQSVHDKTPPDRWEFEFQKVSDKYCLKYYSPE